jgi:hypothetical protein
VAPSPEPGLDGALATLLGFHRAWAWVVILGNGLAGAWALFAQWWVGLRMRALWWFTALVEIAVGVQVAAGIGLVAGQHRHPPPFHPFYGFVAVVVVGLLFVYRGAVWRRRYMLYGFGGLFLMGVAIRALLTASR